MLTLLLLLACAEPETDSGSVDTASVEPATFTEVRDEILLNSCAFSSCHGDQEAGDLALTSEGAYAALVNVPSQRIPSETLVIPGDASGSYLVKKMEGAEGIAGDEMPPGSILSEDKIQTVRSWIDHGALND
jgi:hypothetical protein